MFRNLRKSCGIPALLLTLFVLAATGYAQVFSGSITGTVTDSTGAVVPDATITVTNTGTNVSYPSKTTGAGSYTVPYLAPGDYSVSVTKSGFQTFNENAVHLDPGATVREDIKLTIGATSAVVQVNASSVQLNTDNSTVSGVTPSQVIDVIPNLDNNPLQYLELSNGITPAAETQSTQTVNSFGIGVAGRANDSAFAVNGGRTFENEIEIDGLPDTGQGFNEATILPNLEGIQEVQAITNNFSAEYGHGAGIFEVTTKSGSNKFHGQASYENRNEALMANTSQNKAQDIRRPAFKVDDVGGEVDGPIRKDHVFFSSSFHWVAHNYGTTALSTVPTDLERKGDFGESLISGLGGVATPAEVFNPFSVTQINSNLYQRAEFPKSSNCSSYGCGDVIPNPNSVGVHILSFYPEPNRAPTTPIGHPSNFGTYFVNTIRQETMNNRIDYKRGRQSIYGSGGFDFGIVENPYAFYPDVVKGLNDTPTTTKDRNPYAQLGDTIVFSPTLFLDVRYGGTRTDTINFGGDHSGFSDYAGFGIAPATQALFAVPGSAPVTAPGQWSGLSGGQFVNKQEHQIMHSVNASVTKIKGNWTFKAGTQFRVNLANFTDFEEASANLGGCCANDVGGYTINYVNASGGGVSQNTLPQQQGQSGATVLVGEGVWFVRPGANLKPAYAAKYWALYSENDWKATPKLTINLGLRWEVQPGITERYNRLAGYDFTEKNPFGYLGAIDFPGTMGYSRGLWNTEWNDWQPRLAMNYQLMPTLVVHGGYGVTYLPSNSGYFSSPNDFGEATWATGNTGAETYGANPAGVPTEMITDPAPLVVATLANASAPQTYGVGEAYFDRHMKNQIEKQGNVFLEKTFGTRGQWLLSTGWSGSWANHLSTRNFNFENTQTVGAQNAGLLAGWRQTYINSNGTTQPSSVQVPNPYQPATGPLLPFQGSLSARTVQQIIPYYQYPLLIGGGKNGSTGFSSYNSLQVHFAHHTKSLYLDANYTWSKSLSFVSTAIEDGQGVDATGSIGTPDLVCNHCNQNYDDYDTPHRLVITAVYQSPWGEGQPWALNNRMARGFLGGWSIAPVLTLQDGWPIFLSQGSGQIVPRVNYVGAKGSVPYLLPKSLRHWYNGSTKVTLPCGVTVTPGNYAAMKYNLCIFQSPTVTTPNGTILSDEYWNPNGSNTNGNIRGPGRTNLDGSLRRTFNLAEGFKLDITAATTDVFNHPERNAQPGGGAGGTDVINNPGNGQVLGYGTSGGYGTAGMGTYDRRQVEFIGRILF